MWVWVLLACKNGGESGLGETDDTDDTVEETDTETGAPEDVVAIPSTSVDAILTAMEDDLAAAEASGAQIAVWLDGEIVFTGSVGSAMAVADVPVTRNTLFQIGSDTKKMTALAALRLDARGELGLDDTVATLIPGFELAETPGWAASTTLHHLISHQGGLYDYTPWDDAPDDAELATRALGEFAAREWAHAPGGAMYNYSNPNFSLAGLAVENAAGSPYADALAAEVSGPLGMTRTFHRKADMEADPDVALGSGYHGSSADAFDPMNPSNTFVWDDVVSLDDTSDNGFTRPAGLVWSTASDQATMAGFLIEGDAAILDDARRAAVSTMQVRMYPAWDAVGYGYGLVVYQGINLRDGYHDVRAWAHGGNTLAYTSATWMLPDSRLAVSILSNGYGDDFTLSAVVVMEELGGLGAATTEEPPPSTETDHARLVGTYADPWLGDIVIGELDGALTIELPLLEAMGTSVGATLRFEGVTDVYTLTLDRTRYDLTFVADDDGTYRWAKNRLFVGTRQATAAPRTPPSPPSRAELGLRLAEARRHVPFVFGFEE